MEGKRALEKPVGCQLGPERLSHDSRTRVGVHEMKEMHASRSANMA
jgi:hypothetical protein